MTLLPLLEEEAVFGAAWKTVSTQSLSTLAGFAVFGIVTGILAAWLALRNGHQPAPVGEAPEIPAT